MENEDYTLECDNCNKIIAPKELGGIPWSEWCIYHNKKRRDFCSNDCLKNWIDNYFKDKNMDVNKSKAIIKKTITKEFKFDSSHRLNDDSLSVEENKVLFGKCNNSPSHGHTYHLFVTVSGKAHNGMIVNFSMLRDIVERNVIEKFDHHFINDVPEMKGIITTCENQIAVIWALLLRPLDNIDLTLEELKLYETETSYATMTK